MPRVCAGCRYDGEQCLLIDEVHLTKMLMEDFLVTLWDAISVLNVSQDNGLSIGKCILVYP